VNNKYKGDMGINDAEVGSAAEVRYKRLGEQPRQCGLGLHDVGLELRKKGNEN